MHVVGGPGVGQPSRVCTRGMRSLVIYVSIRALIYQKKRLARVPQILALTKHGMPSYAYACQPAMDGRIKSNSTFLGCGSSATSVY